MLHGWNFIIEIELAETPKTPEDRGRGHTIIDDLKELNLGTNEEPPLPM